MSVATPAVTDDAPTRETREGAERVRPFRARAGRRRKRLLDIAVALVGLTLTALLSPLIALAIRLDSRGPVLYAQTRIGLDGRPFRMIKFRSMVTGADDAVRFLRARNDASGPLFKVHADPRVTRVGRFLRTHSLDELPQFWNVLVGDMSAVGPRPALPEEVAAYDAAARRRLQVPPGLTGPWQVGGRSDLSWADGLRLDLRYVDTWTVRGDIRLLARTVLAVTRPQGAY